MNLPEPHSLMFRSLINDIERGRLKIPQFQRDFIWDLKKSADLLDSIIKGYPIGSFIFWRTEERLRSIREIGGCNFPDPKDGEIIDYVLDGQQRLTTLYVSMKGLKIQREQLYDYGELYIDLEASGEEQLIILEKSDREDKTFIKFTQLLTGDFAFLAGFPEKYQNILSDYKNRIESYNFSIISIREAPIDIATEIFTRINIGGKPLSLFEIMVAKTFDLEHNFDLAEKFEELIEELRDVNYETISDATVLQTIAVILKNDCTRKQILKLDKGEFIGVWGEVVDAIKSTIDYFRSGYKIPVSKLLPYNALVVPFAYFFYNHKDRPVGKKREYLQDFFWRCAIAERYSSSVESRIGQDIRKIDQILKDDLPKYDWPIDYSPDYLIEYGYFTTSRSFIKAILCLFAFFEPKSFIDNATVWIDNSWLKQANSKNYHHFFPKAFLKKRGAEDSYINHILNITIVDDYLNKRVIRAKAPATYMKEFEEKNPQLAKTMISHLITDLTDFGVWDNDYDKFLNERAKKISKELGKRIIQV